MTGNVQLYLPEKEWSLTRMEAPLGGFAPGVKDGDSNSGRSGVGVERIA